MKLSLYTDDLREAPVDMLALGVFSDEPDRGLAFSQLNTALNGALAQACKDEDFKGKPGQTVVVNVAWSGPARRVLVYGYGPKAQYSAESTRRFAGTAARIARKVGASTMALQLSVPDAPTSKVLDLMQSFAEGTELGYYRYDVYRRKETSEGKLEEVHVAFAAEDV
ncbi:MAG: M17 family peptidase N-terminal domain-containing protein, partial [Myxococcota bacterium]